MKDSKVRTVDPWGRPVHPRSAIEADAKPAAALDADAKPAAALEVDAKPVDARSNSTRKAGRR